MDTITILKIAGGICSVLSAGLSFTSAFMEHAKEQEELGKRIAEEVSKQINEYKGQK